MIAEILTRYSHFLFIITMSAALVGEALLLRPSMTRSDLKRIAGLDAVYGLSALLLVGAGLVLWFAVGKPAEFYTKNPVFHVKLTLAVLLGLISIYPTVFYIKNSRGNQMEETIDIPRGIKTAVYIQLFILAFVPLLATIMAKGIGLSVQ